MMKIYSSVLLLLLLESISAQSDTIVVKDYSKIFITTNRSGNIEPVTDYSELKKAGFFLNEVSDGILRICNENELFIWVEGRLISSVEGCNYFDPETLFQFTESDTIFVSFSTSGFENFKCELVVYEKFITLKEEVSEPRQVRDIFREFSILAFVLLLAGFSLFATSFPGRLNFFISKTFSLKASSYQFINTSFFGRANIFMILIACLTIAFEIIYVNQKVELMIFPIPMSLIGYVLMWLIISLWIVIFYLVKRVFIQIIASLFQIKKLKDWQLFDLVNFSGYFFLILFIIILWDFILKDSNESWIISYFSYYFIAVMLLFEIWFVIKFVINSSYQKLLIISYLCATEIIPSILIMVWFYK